MSDDQVTLDMSTSKPVNTPAAKPAGVTLDMSTSKPLSSPNKVTLDMGTSKPVSSPKGVTLDMNTSKPIAENHLDEDTQNAVDRLAEHPIEGATISAQPSTWDRFKGAVEHPIDYLKDVEEDTRGWRPHRRGSHARTLAARNIVGYGVHR